jgi:hypothetical protein
LKFALAKWVEEYPIFYYNLKTIERCPIKIKQVSHSWK